MALRETGLKCATWTREETARERISTCSTGAADQGLWMARRLFFCTVILLGMTAYAELHALSAFSFRRGVALPQELVQRAQALGYQALALTDECSMAGVVRAHEAARDCAMKLIVGSEVRLRGDGFRLVLLAPDQTAYSQICRLITRARRRAPKGQYDVRLDDLDERLDQ